MVLLEGGPSNEEADVDAVAFERTEEVDNALSHLAVMFFQHLHSVLEEPNLTTVKYESECAYFGKYTSKAGAVAGVFSGLPSEVSTAVVFSPSWIQVDVTGGTGSASGAPAHSLSGAGAVPSGQGSGEDDFQPASGTLRGKKRRRNEDVGIDGAVMAGTERTGGGDTE